MRPLSSKSMASRTPSGRSSAQPEAANAAMKASARRRCFTGCGRRASASGLEALDGLLQRLVVRRVLDRFVPDALGLGALAGDPEDFAKMRADFAIRAALVGAAQVLQRARKVSHAVIGPSHAVDDEQVLGRENHGFLDELLGLVEPHVAIGERV